MIRLDGEDALIRGRGGEPRAGIPAGGPAGPGQAAAAVLQWGPSEDRGELSGILNTVLFCPEDLLLIREGRRPAALLTAPSASCAPGMPRRWRSTTACMSTRPASSGTGWRTPPLLETLEDFNVRMAQTGALVIRYRAYFVRRLQEAAPAVHRDFSGGREAPPLTYQTVSSVSDPMAAPQQILEQLRDHQERHRQAELDARQCLSGPTKTTCWWNWTAARPRHTAPRGRPGPRPCPSSWPSGTFSSRRPGSTPVLLLDDVLSELDARRQAFVLNHIQGARSSSPAVRRRSWKAWRGRGLPLHGGALV